MVVHPGVGTIEREPLADAHVPMQPGALRDALLLMSEYFERVQRLPQPMDLLPSEQQELDLLRFIHTRGVKEIRPVMDGSSTAGFHYPVPEVLLDLDPLSTLRVLKEYESRGLLTGQIEERVYLCASCSSSRLIFREICPKCQRLLRHIGVDYDMPDSTLECGACAEQWVEGYVQARCLDCDHRCSPEEARLTDVRTYSPTPSMHRAAKDPVPPLSTPNKLLMTALQTLEPQTYGIILDHTIRVCERYKRPAAVLQVSIEGLTEGHHREGFPLNERVHITGAGFRALGTITEISVADRERPLSLLKPYEKAVIGPAVLIQVDEVKHGMIRAGAEVKVSRAAVSLLHWIGL